MRSVGHRPRTGRIESIILSRSLDAIRESRIASQDGFRDTPRSRAASEVRTRCVSTKTASLARAEQSLGKRRGIEITDLKANTARVGARSSCATRLCANRNRKSHSCLARAPRVHWRESMLYVNHVSHQRFVHTKPRTPRDPVAGVADPSGAEGAPL